MNDLELAIYEASDRILQGNEEQFEIISRLKAIVLDAGIPAESIQAVVPQKHYSTMGGWKIDPPTILFRVAGQNFSLAAINSHVRLSGGDRVQTFALPTNVELTGHSLAAAVVNIAGNAIARGKRNG